MSSNFILIDNVTEKDVKARKVRITVGNKHLFPNEKLGKPATYSLTIKIDNQKYLASYTIGSKDGKARSGILKLGDDIYQKLLKISAGTNLKITVEDEGVYSIKRL
jgi:hypothetical protein